MFDPVDEIHSQSFRWACLVDIGNSFREFFKDDLDLKSCEARAEAEMRSASTEGRPTKIGLASFSSTMT